MSILEGFSSFETVFVLGKVVHNCFCEKMETTPTLFKKRKTKSCAALGGPLC